jgi:predicted RNA-binding protein with RPS1 domain
MELSVTRPRSHDWSFGEAPCSVEGLLPAPWERVAAELHVGDIVQGRVVHIVDQQNYALIELLPDAAGIVFRPEVDHTFVEAIEDFLRVDELVDVKILALDVEAQRASLSVKAAQTSQSTPRALPALIPGGVPFEWRAFLARSGVEFTTTQGPREARIQELEGELAAANEDRSSLRQTVTSLRQDMRSLQGRYQDLERRATGELDPLSDERAFLRAVRLWHAREIGEGERSDYPLQSIRVGRQFLDTARSLDGISAEKIVEVAGQVACGRAKDLEGRDLHALGVAGPATATRQRERVRDGAKAWRCALQVKSASARRLHWWLIPGPNGGTIEFASVAVHDMYDIPE